MTDWQEVKLGDVCDLIAGFAFKSKDFGNYPDKVIKITNIEPPFVNMENLAGVDLAIYNKDKLEKFMAYPGDYVLAMTGATIGKLGRIFEGNAYINQRVLMSRPKECIYKRFLYYILSKYQFTQYIFNHIDSESAQPNIGATTIGKYKFSLPPMSVQRKIARVLGVLDDKIELNNKINNNLEQQAQALFKSWFIDFEPFGGTMPDDWKERDIYSIANIIYGAPFASKLFNTEKRGVPIIRIRDLKNQYSNTYTEEMHPKSYTIKAGDIVVGMDGEFRPYIWGNDEGLLNQRICVFENKRSLGKMFLYLAIKPLLNRVEQTEVATTVIHIGKQDFDAFRFYMPTSDILDKFDKITNPIYGKIVSNSLENTRLSALRDTLLPKLMSGEIDVKNARLPEMEVKENLL